MKKLSLSVLLMLLTSNAYSLGSLKDVDCHLKKAKLLKDYRLIELAYADERIYEKNISSYKLNLKKDFESFFKSNKNFKKNIENFYKSQSDLTSPILTELAEPSLTAKRKSELNAKLEKISNSDKLKGKHNPIKSKKFIELIKSWEKKLSAGQGKQVILAAKKPEITAGNLFINLEFRTELGMDESGDILIEFGISDIDSVVVTSEYSNNNKSGVMYQSEPQKAYVEKYLGKDCLEKIELASQKNSERGSKRIQSQKRTNSRSEKNSTEE